MDLILPLKKRWFLEIQAGVKHFEYRLDTPYWQKRLIGKSYENVVFTLGYPSREDASRRITRTWLGYEMQTVVSDEWSGLPVRCFAIYVSN